jgi:hypothetical protein
MDKRLSLASDFAGVVAISWTWVVTSGLLATRREK